MSGVGIVTAGTNMPFFETGGGFDQTVQKASDAWQYALGATSAESAENPPLAGCIILALAAALVIGVLAYLIYKICKCAGCCCFGSQNRGQTSTDNLQHHSGTEAKALS